MKKLAITLVLCSLYGICWADGLQWGLPGGFGTVQLPFQSTELLLGEDFVLGQGIGGVSLPVLTLFPGKLMQLDGQLGAVGAFPTQSANVQPYLALGKDIARLIPVLDSFKSLHINGFGRYATDVGKPGAGVSVSYSFN